MNGIKIDISISEEYYYKVLKQEQQRNTILGYGTNQNDWNKIKYEEQRRELMYEKRTNPQKPPEHWVQEERKQQFKNNIKYEGEATLYIQK